MNMQESKYCGCLYYSANALGRVMTRLAENAFASTGLAPSYALLLLGVNEQPGIHPKELSQMMQLTPSTVTRLIEKLEYNGLVERKNKGRNTEVYPTESSLAMQEMLQSSWQRLHRRYAELLGEEQAQKLTRDVYEAYRRLSA